MAWKVKTPEEARQCGEAVGHGDGVLLAQSVSYATEAENFGDARWLQERFWKRVETLRQTHVGRWGVTFDGFGYWPESASGPTRVLIEGQDSRDAFVAAYEEAARAAFEAG